MGYGIFIGYINHKKIDPNRTNWRAEDGIILFYSWG